MYQIISKQAKPILKWAGGKTQLLQELKDRLPSGYNQYIEPFFGGGALFFYLLPSNAIIADSNPELINLYTCIKKNPKKIIKLLAHYKNEKDFFYAEREKVFEELDPFEAAARTIYLNRTCFNGLYRVNKKGGFNVPFANYSNPRICDEENIIAVSYALKNTKIVLGDYLDVLGKYAKKGDFIFLDPPYIPISENSDFKRYTKDQFNRIDQENLSKEVSRLKKLGANVILTNSNHPEIYDLYKGGKIDIIKTKRNINCNGDKRSGEDAIVTITPTKKQDYKFFFDLPDQIKKYPSTRWMGSKSKLLAKIYQATKDLKFETAIDLFAGSGIVGYLFKTMGKEVISNDYMALSQAYGLAMIENNETTLKIEDAKALLENPIEKFDCFVQDTYKDLYFTDSENLTIDILRHNTKNLKNPYHKYIALSALARACTKKRPRGVFTYVGHRYDDGRKDLQISLEDHFLNAINEINNAVFDNKRPNRSTRVSALEFTEKADLVYFDPPYYSPHSDNEYVRRYHFTEGIVCDWEGVDMQWHTQTKKFKSYPTPFSSKVGAYEAFDKLFEIHKNSILVVSYSSNSFPTLEEIVILLKKYKKKVSVHKIDYKYSFGNQKEEIKNNQVQEYLFIAQ